MLKKKVEKKVKKKVTYICPNCKGSKIESKAWVLLNDNNRFVELVDSDEDYCQDCEKTIEVNEQVELIQE